MITNHYEEYKKITVLLAQIEARSSSYKLKCEIRITLNLFYQQNKVIKSSYNILINTI